MDRKLEYKKIPKTYESGFLDYSEYADALDSTPEWPEFYEAGYTWDEYLKFLQLIAIEHAKYMLLTEELTEELTVEEANLIVENMIKEYNNM